jgi:hypothetical protein
VKRPLALLALLWAITLTLAGAAHSDSGLHPDTFAGDTTIPALDSLASHWARRPVHVECPADWAAWNADESATGSYGYTWLDADWTRVEPDVCANAVRANGPLNPLETDDVAVAVLVITHESWHLRIWQYRADEGRVECKAIQNYRQSLRELGVTDPKRIAMLYSLAWSFDRREATLFPEYRFKRCRIQKPSADW